MELEMSIAQTNVHSNETINPPSRGMVFALALGAGSAVASIYYNQPILQMVGSELGLGAGTTGLIPTVTQAGYALGILFLLPLGDRYDRRTLIVLKSIFLSVMLLLGSLSPSLNTMLLTSLMIGITATMAQDIVPAAAILAPKHEQGKTIGAVMTGLLLGILLSRTVSGLIAEYFGWRVVLQLAAIEILVIGFALRKILPTFKTHAVMSYPKLLQSLFHLWRDHPALRHASIAQALLAIAFSAIWSSLSLVLHQRYQLGSDIAGMFGLLGAVGALLARYAGSLSDRHGPALITKLGATVLILSFGLMSASVLSSSEVIQLGLLAIGTIGFDLGVQASLVSHQSIVYRIVPEARSRLNSIFFTVMFVGMASGSVLGTQLYDAAGFLALMAIGIVAGIASLAVRLLADQSD